MLTEQKKQILRVYAENAMNAAEVARKLHYHRNTVDYHLDNIRMSTGLNPRNLYDLIKLLEIVERMEEEK